MENSFYVNGLKFECTRCSNCCRHEPGYVYLSRGDIRRIAEFLGMDEQGFLSEYCRTLSRPEGIRRSLKEKENFDCIFWESDGCVIYPVRPFQCKSYPFWEHYLHSKEAWEGLRSSCPGINQGKLYSFDEIEHWIGLRKQEIYEIENRK